MYKLLLIAIGGAVGTLARYGTGTLLQGTMQRDAFPWATFAVNVVGCFLIGLLYGLFQNRWPLVPVEYRQMLLVGFLGGFTTFSSFGWETTALLRDAQWFAAAVTVLANNVVGIALVLVGYNLGHGKP